MKEFIGEMKYKWSSLMTDWYLAKRNNSHDINIMVKLLCLYNQGNDYDSDYFIYENYFFMKSSEYTARNFKKMGFKLFNYKKLEFNSASVVHSREFNIAIHVMLDTDFKILHHAMGLAKAIEISEPHRINMLKNSYVSMKALLGE